MSPDVEPKDRLPDEQVIAQIGTLVRPSLSSFRSNL
jgi:hypothetical protein